MRCAIMILKSKRRVDPDLFSEQDELLIALSRGEVSDN